MAGEALLDTVLFRIGTWLVEAAAGQVAGMNSEHYRDHRVQCSLNFFPCTEAGFSFECAEFFCFVFLSGFNHES